MGAQGIENTLIIFIIYDYRAEKKKLCKDINIKRQFYSIQSTFEIFRNVEICTNKIPKSPMFPLPLELKDMFLRSARIQSFLGKQCKCCEHCDPTPNLLEVFTKSFLNLMHCCCSSPPRFMSMEFSQQLTILSEVIDTRNACQDSKRGLWKGI
jgi:hypothetical protein